MKVAIVHDFLVEAGGAEQVLKSLHHLYPDAPIYVLLYDSEKLSNFLDNADIRCSFLQKFPKFLKNRRRLLFPLMTIAPETFDLRDFDLVISSSNSFAKAIITKPKTVHICYCHSPMRFAWDWYSESIKEYGNFFTKSCFAAMMNYFRIWDKSSADRVDYFVANSNTTSERIQKYYKKKSLVIYPPVDVKLASCEQISHIAKFALGSYFLVVSRLSRYKRIDLVVEAFNKLQLPLKIIGEGKELSRLKKIASRNIDFLGFQEEEEKRKYLQNCFAFIFPGEDDFGISPVEAMSFGKPILAYKKGGAVETMVEGKTGEFFNAATSEILAEGVRRLMNRYDQYDPFFIAQHASQYERQSFELQFSHFVDRVMDFKKK